MIFVHTICDDIEEAQDLSGSIIEKGLGACVDFWPISSCCNINGQTTCNTRVKVLITTLELKLEAINRLIRENNPNSVPLVAGVDVRRINHPYKEWMMGVIH